MLQRSHALSVVALTWITASVACRVAPPIERNDAAPYFVAPGEFEPQEFVWLSWNEAGFLGGPSFADTTVEVLRALTPHVRVRLIYSDWTGYVERCSGMAPLSTGQAEARLRARLSGAGIDLGRVELFHWDRVYGAIQDPGPYFLRRSDGRLALTDYAFVHPDPAVEAMDRDIAARLGLLTIPSPLASEAGARQSNGKGTLLLVESVELDRNPGWTRDAIEAEHLRVNGARKAIWLRSGPAEEEWGRLSDGRWGIGTGGHVDEFARFADAQTILLAEVPEADRERHPLVKETHARMEENLARLRAATDQDGQPFRILRVPVAELMTARVEYDELDPIEREWFEGAAPGEEIEFYLPGSYLNFILANGVVVTSRYWRAGEPEVLRTRDELARAALQAAFPDRSVVQVDARSMLYDGGGLHCWSCTQPFARAGS